jgi:hypothetical protein
MQIFSKKEPTQLAQHGRDNTLNLRDITISNYTVKCGDVSYPGSDDPA